MQRTQANTNSQSQSSPNKLTSDNYEAWAIRSRIKLLAKGCWEVVEGSEPKPSGDRAKEMKWMQTNYTALASIMDWVDDAQLDHIRDCATANEAWTKLRAIHESKGMQRVLSLSLSLLNFQIEKNESVDSATARLSKMTRELSQLGAPITESLKISILLNSLPEPWIIRLAGTESLRWADMVARVKLEERWQRDRGTETVLAVYDVGTSGRRFNERRKLVPEETNGAKKNDTRSRKDGGLQDEDAESERGHMENGNEEAGNGNDTFSNPMRKPSSSKAQTSPGPARKWSQPDNGPDQSPSSYSQQPFLGYNSTIKTYPPPLPPPQTTPRPNPLPNPLPNSYGFNNYNQFQPQVFPLPQTSPKTNFVQPGYNPYQQNQHQTTPQQRRTSMSSFNPQALPISPPISESSSPEAIKGLGGPFNRPQGSKSIQIVNPNTGAKVKIERVSSVSTTNKPVTAPTPTKSHSRSASRSTKTEQEKRDEMKATVTRKLEEDRLRREENARKEAEKLKKEAENLKKEEEKKKKEEEKKKKEEEKKKREEERLKKEVDWLKREEKRLQKEENAKKSREEQANDKKRIEAEENEKAPPPSVTLMALKSARFIKDLNSINYPADITPPNLTLSTAPGKFKYERDFLLQFQPVFTEKPSAGWDIRMRWAFGDIDSRPGAKRRQPKPKKEDSEEIEKASESGETEVDSRDMGASLLLLD